MWIHVRAWAYLKYTSAIKTINSTTEMIPMNVLSCARYQFRRLAEQGSLLCAYVCVNSSACMRLYMFVPGAFLCICMYMSLHACVYVCEQTSTFLHACKCCVCKHKIIFYLVGRATTMSMMSVCVCIYVCMFGLCVWVVIYLFIYIYIYIYTHTHIFI